jgi:hypothetical protein
LRFANCDGGLNVLNPGDIKVVSQTEEFVPAGQTGSVPGLRITFTVRGQGPYSVKIAKSDFTAQNVMTLIQAYAEQIAALFDQGS